MTFTETKHMHSHLSHFFVLDIALKPINRCFLKELIKTIFPETLLLLLNVHTTRIILIYFNIAKYNVSFQIFNLNWSVWRSFTPVKNLKSCLLNTSVIIHLKILLCFVTQDCI